MVHRKQYCANDLMTCATLREQPHRCCRATIRFCLPSGRDIRLVLLIRRLMYAIFVLWGENFGGVLNRRSEIIFRDFIIMAASIVGTIISRSIFKLSLLHHNIY